MKLGTFQRFHGLHTELELMIEDANTPDGREPEDAPTLAELAGLVRDLVECLILDAEVTA